MTSKLFFGLVWLCFLVCPQWGHAADWRQQFISQLGNGSVYVEDGEGKSLLAHRMDAPFIPASTIKVATAAAALNILGPDYRFKTFFYLTATNDLYVKGYGDPFLVSEEMKAIASRLKAGGLQHVRDIVCDISFFSPNIMIDGIARSDNPYDAVNGALIANFNTIEVQKFKNGTLRSAETQTPLTKMALERAKKLRSGNFRINLGGNEKSAALYFGELLAAFLKEQGVEQTGIIRVGQLKPGLDLFYCHESSKKLTDLLSLMLKHSTNMIANQIFLVMGTKKLGEPASVEKGIQVVSAFLRQYVGWNHFNLAEGSGLSKKTFVTARQMMQLLRYFESSKDLLPVKEKLFQAKTGTLNGVNTLMGYFPLDHGEEARFVILINDQVPYAQKFKLAKDLYTHFNGLPGKAVKNE